MAFSSNSPVGQLWSVSAKRGDVYKRGKKERKRETCNWGRRIFQLRKRRKKEARERAELQWWKKLREKDFSTETEEEDKDGKWLHCRSNVKQGKMWTFNFERWKNWVYNALIDWSNNDDEEGQLQFQTSDINSTLKKHPCADVLMTGANFMRRGNSLLDPVPDVLQYIVPLFKSSHRRKSLLSQHHPRIHSEVTRNMNVNWFVEYNLYQFVKTAQ